MTLPLYACGHDFGNAETGVILIDEKGRQYSRSVPSNTAPGRFSELAALGVKLTNSDFVYRDETTELYVGNLALSQATMSSTSRNDIHRYWGRKSLHLLLTTAASLIEEDDFALNVVTGLPVRTYIEDPGARTRVKEALEGTHIFMLNNRRRCATVVVERVIMEGAGAIIAYGLKDRGVTQGAVDIGGRTTDVYVASGQTPLRDYCTGRPLGVELAGDHLSAAFQSLYGRTLKQDERRGILRAYASSGHNLYPRIYVEAKEVLNLRSLAEAAMNAVSADIVSFVSGIWNESETGKVASSFARVILVGGGAYYFRRQIQAIIPHINKDGDGEEIVIERPELANALGYAGLAESQTRRNIRIA